MKKSRIYKCLAWLLVLAFMCSSMFVATGTAEAANANKKIKSIIVSTDGKKVAKKTVTLRKGKKVTLKVSVSPRKAKKHITYKSSKKSVAAVSKKGRITAKKAGTAKITITVSGKGYKKKTAWVKIRVVNSKDTTESEPSITPLEPDTPAPATPEPSTQTPDVPTPEPSTPEPNMPTPAPDTPTPDTPTPDIQPPVTDKGKSLVVYFSRTGNTKAVA